MKNLYFILSVCLLILANSVYSQTLEIYGVTKQGGTHDAGVIYKTDTDGNYQEVVHSFEKIQGSRPWHTQLCEADNGRLYGLTYEGGLYNQGTLFEYNPEDNTFVSKVDFQSPGPYGADPAGSLVKATNGKLYGMTSYGGNSGSGVIFEYDPFNNSIRKRIDFENEIGGGWPYGDLIQATNGKFYGMTTYGGENNEGVLFEYQLGSNTLTVLEDFVLSITGGHPKTNSLFEASNGKLYGLTVNGGANSCGVLFEYDIATNTFIKKVDFSEVSSGRWPYGALVEASNGDLYGMCKAGGTSEGGTLFQYNVSTGDITKKIDFDGSSNGNSPHAGLFVASNGKLYGLTRSGGANDNGVLFEYDPITSVYLMKFNFDSKTKGAYPMGELMEASNGKLYGLTSYGGTNSIVTQEAEGALFEYVLGSSSLTTKLAFGSATYGHSPNGGLLLAANGNYYGITENGGLYGQGIIYEFEPTTNSFVKLYDFDGYLSNGDGNGGTPTGALIEGASNTLYGMTSEGGADNKGVLFKYNYMSSSYTKILDFDGTNGQSPKGSLLKASNNKIYGMTFEGGSGASAGVLFELNSDSYTKILDFEDVAKGKHPHGGIIEASNGLLYGLTQEGGINGDGVLFELDPSDNSFTKKYDFIGLSPLAHEGSFGSLVQASNGMLYGTTQGFLFEYNYNTNSLINKYTFSSSGYGSCSGWYPKGILMQSSNSKLYGVTQSGGDSDLGVLFEYDPITSAILDKLSFDKSNGALPEYGHLVEITNTNYTWTGAIDSNWLNPLNWAGEDVPDTLDNVVIPVGRTNYPHLLDTAVCTNFTLKSNAYGDASFIENKMLFAFGDITIERYLSGFNSSSSGWHYLSSPMKDINIANSDFVPSTNVDDLYLWDESISEWSNYNGGSFEHDSFEEGLGYLVGYTITSTKHFVGELNSDSITKNLGFTAGMGDGWNLLGNPYSSAIKWDSLIKTETMDGSFYIVDPINGTYLVSNSSGGDLPNGEIPINQAFLVKANSELDSLIFTTNAQTNSNNNFNKSNTGRKETLIIKLDGQNSSNNTYLQFNENATMAYDRKIDAYKLFGYANIAQVYTEMDDIQYAINNLAYSNESISVPLNIQLFHDEELTLNITGIDSFDSQVGIDLEDLKTGTITNIRKNAIYTFQATTADDANRFILHFNGVTAVGDIEETQSHNPLIYTFNNTIYIQTKELKNADIFIYNMSGQLVGIDELNGENIKRLHSNLSTGVYMVSVQSETSRWNQKVYVK